MLVICACLAGAASSVRELVKERAIYIRERAAGLSSGAYLSSKLLVLGVISVVQSFILVLIGVAGRPMPLTARSSPAPRWRSCCSASPRWPSPRCAWACSCPPW